MTKVMTTIYEAYLQAIQDGALEEAQVLSDELDQLAIDAQQISPLSNLVIR
jgi:hypothetical protein